MGEGEAFRHLMMYHLDLTLVLWAELEQRVGEAAMQTLIVPDGHKGRRVQLEGCIGYPLKTLPCSFELLQHRLPEPRPWEGEGHVFSDGD